MSDQTRVLLWTLPWSCSTMLLKSLSNIPDSQMIFELFTTAYNFGPDKLKPTVSPEEIINEGIKLDENSLLKGPGSGFKSSICTFEWVKRQLEADYQGKKVIIAKEFAPYVNRRYDLIPEGYRHMFLIRNPYKVFPSWKKIAIELSSRKLTTEDPVLDQSYKEVIHHREAYKEITDLWLHIKENNLDTDPIIINSDDLLQNPKEILSAACSKVGLPYSDSLLSWHAWEAGSKVVDQWMVSNAIKTYTEQYTTCFTKPAPESEIPDLATFSPDVKCCIEYSMPHYLKMFEQRLKC